MIDWENQGDISMTNNIDWEGIIKELPFALRDNYEDDTKLCDRCGVIVKATQKEIDSKN